MSPGTPTQDVIAQYRLACEEYDVALAEYKNAKANHVDLRQTYLKELVRDLAIQNNTDQASELNRLRHIEQQRGTHTKIHYALKPQHRDGVQSILIPSKSSYHDQNTDHRSVEEM